MRRKAHTIQFLGIKKSRLGVGTVGIYDEVQFLGAFTHTDSWQICSSHVAAGCGTNGGSLDRVEKLGCSGAIVAFVILFVQLERPKQLKIICKRKVYNVPANPSWH